MFLDSTCMIIWIPLLPFTRTHFSLHLHIPPTPHTLTLPLIFTLTYTGWSNARQSTEVCLPVDRHHALPTAERSHTPELPPWEHTGMYFILLPWSPHERLAERLHVQQRIPILSCLCASTYYVLRTMNSRFSRSRPIQLQQIFCNIPAQNAGILHLDTCLVTQFIHACI